MDEMPYLDLPAVDIFNERTGNFLNSSVPDELLRAMLGRRLIVEPPRTDGGGQSGYFV